MENQLTVKALVFTEKDQIVTDSLTIAESFNKEHARVMRDIRELDCSDEFRVGNFAESTYINQQGREYPRALISQDGFSFLVMGYTGEKASEFKEKYINEFNRMKNEINMHKLPTTYKQALLALVEAEEEKERLQLIIEENKPMVSFAETCLKSSDSILVRELVKVAQDQKLEIGEKRLWVKLREWNLILKNSTEPSQYGMNLKLFEVEEKNVNTPYGIKLVSQTRVLPKGQVFIIEKLKNEIKNK